jgi:hypothetical protein
LGEGSGAITEWWRNSINNGKGKGKNRKGGKGEKWKGERSKGGREDEKMERVKWSEVEVEVEVVGRVVGVEGRGNQGGAQCQTQRNRQRWGNMM